MPQTLKASTPTEVLAGLVDRVTFHNSDNGFCVLRVKTRGQRDLITVVGHAAIISAGEFVQASGFWINDRTHGALRRVQPLKKRVNGGRRAGSVPFLFHRNRITLRVRPRKSRQVSTGSSVRSRYHRPWVRPIIVANRWMRQASMPDSRTRVLNISV